MKILIIDDNLAILDGLKKALGSLGHEVLTKMVFGSKGLDLTDCEAVSHERTATSIMVLVAEFRPELIMIDERMGDYSGRKIVECAPFLRNDHIPLLGISETDQQEYCRCQFTEKSRSELPKYLGLFLEQHFPVRVPAIAA